MSKLLNSDTKSSLILASSSIYRQDLLKRLGIHFTVVKPDVNETPLPNESPIQIAQRLAKTKAKFVSNAFADAIVIGSDQVAELNGQALGKPIEHHKAVAQLLQMSGQTVLFHSAVCVVRQQPYLIHQFVVTTAVDFRFLVQEEIERYLALEPAYDCAGSAKSEGLGIVLTKRIESTDPTALVGLPLIQLSDTLRHFGILLP
jgi:septum formation protein